MAASDLSHILRGYVQKQGNEALPENTHQKHKKKAKRKKGFDDDSLAFAVFDRNGELLMSDGDHGDNFIYQEHQGFSQSYIRGDDDKWQIFWLPVGVGDERFTIAVGQELDYRNELINGIVLAQMWVWLASLPLLLALIIVILNKEFKVLGRVSSQVIDRSPEESRLLDTQRVPSEILPLVESLNGFFERTATMLLRERRFTSDAAHELRSLLAALRVQTEVAQMVNDSQMRNDALANMLTSIDRASQLIEQLLTLSRLDSIQQLDDLQTINWPPFIQSVIGELYFNAQKQAMEIAFIEQGQPTLQQGQTLLLTLMLRNIIENAIKYCPSGSKITLYLTATRLIVQDNGGGVEEQDLDKLGNRFYRPAGQNEKGSGLGLSIVQRIAELHHYQVKISNGHNELGEKGLRVEIDLNTKG